MKRKVLSLLLALVLVLALVPEFTSHTQAAGSWQDSYADLLQDELEKGRWGKESWWNSTIGHFYVYDMDKDGVPELILTPEDSGDYIMPGEVYTYRGGGAEKIGEIDIVLTESTATGGFVSVHIPSDNALGIYVARTQRDEAWQYHYTIRNGVLHGQKIDFYSGSKYPSTKITFHLVTDESIKTHIYAGAKPAQRHYFATELERFNEENAGASFKVAYLHDLDNDGENEVIAVAGNGSVEYDMIPVFNGTLAVFDVENETGKTAKIDIKASGFGSYRIYASPKGYIVVEEPDEWSTRLTAYQYKSGSLTKAESFDGPDGGGGYSGLTESEYYAKVEKYGIGDKALQIISGSRSSKPSSVQASSKDRTNEILAMIAAPLSITVNPTTSTVFVNGLKIAFEAYNIDGNNFFKLRDLAMVFSITEKRFEVGYNEATKAITLTSGVFYTPVGGELAEGDGTPKKAVPTASKVYLDGKELSLTAYNIGGNNFFKLRDLMNAIDVSVGYDGATGNITLDTSFGYTP